MHVTSKAVPQTPLRSNGGSILKQSDALRQLHQNYAQHGSPSCFYLTIDLRTESIIWCHNTKDHVGRTTLTYKEYISRIKPHWRATIKASSDQAMRCFRDLKSANTKGQLNYFNNVPIRHEGSYHWYKQRSFPASFDAKGNPVHIFTEFNRFCPFDNLVPSPAYILVNGKVDKHCFSQILKAGGNAMSTTLSELLTPAGYKNLLAYRRSCKRVDNKWAPPSSQEILRVLNMNQTALNKANYRLLKTLKVCFPGGTLSSMTEFAIFLNKIIGPPGR